MTIQQLLIIGLSENFIKIQNGLPYFPGSCEFSDELVSCSCEVIPTEKSCPFDVNIVNCYLMNPYPHPEIQNITIELLKHHPEVLL